MPSSTTSRPRSPDLVPDPPAPLQIHGGFMMSLNVWFVIRALFGIATVVGITKLAGASIWLGVTIGCAIAFVAANGRR